MAESSSFRKHLNRKIQERKEGQLPGTRPDVRPDEQDPEQVLVESPAEVTGKVTNEILPANTNASVLPVSVFIEKPHEIVDAVSPGPSDRGEDPAEKPVVRRPPPPEKNLFKRAGQFIKSTARNLLLAVTLSIGGAGNASAELPPVYSNSGGTSSADDSSGSTFSESVNSLPEVPPSPSKSLITYLQQGVSFTDNNIPDTVASGGAELENSIEVNPVTINEQVKAFLLGQNLRPHHAEQMAMIRDGITQSDVINNRLSRDVLERIHHYPFHSPVLLPNSEVMIDRVINQDGSEVPTTDAMLEFANILDVQLFTDEQLNAHIDEKARILVDTVRLVSESSNKAVVVSFTPGHTYGVKEGGWQIHPKDEGRREGVWTSQKDGKALDEAVLNRLITAEALRVIEKLKANGELENVYAFDARGTAAEQGEAENISYPLPDATPEQREQSRLEELYRPPRTGRFIAQSLIDSGIPVSEIINLETHHDFAENQPPGTYTPLIVETERSGERFPHLFDFLRRVDPAFEQRQLK